MIELDVINSEIKFTISDSCYESLKDYKFYERKNGKYRYIYGVIRNKDTAQRESRNLYKLILGCDTKGKHVIHKDGNKYNYCSDNLVLVNSSIGKQGNHRHNNKIFYKGVSVRKRLNKQKYVAILYKDGRQYTFSADNEIEAAIAYNVLALKHLGEYAELNEVDCNNYDEVFNKIKALVDKEKSLRNSERNQGIPRGHSSKYKGVCYSNEKNKWIAKIKKNFKTYNLGYYTKEEDAARAYDKKAIELYGYNARTNFEKS